MGKVPYEFASVGSKSSSTGTCKDPVAQNYKGKGLCKYPSAGKNGITTSTPFTLYANRLQQPKPKYLFLSMVQGAKAAEDLSSNTTTVPITNNADFIFNFSMLNCPWTNTARRQGGQIYYGDYVQLTIQTSDFGTLYFNPTYGNTDNPFSSAPGDCTTNSFQTLQVLKVDSNGNLSVSNNDPVLMGDEIALVAVSSGVLNQPDGGQKGWVIQVTTASGGGYTANLTGPGMNFLLPQNANTEHKLDLKLDYKAFGKEFKKVTGSTNDTSWGYMIFAIFVIFCLIILVIYIYNSGHTLSFYD